MYICCTFHISAIGIKVFGNLLVALSSVSWWVVVSLRRYVKIARFFSSIAYDEHTYTYSLSSAGSVWCFCYSFFNNNFITSAFSFSSVLPCFWCASSFFCAIVFYLQKHTYKQANTTSLSGSFTAVSLVSYLLVYTVDHSLFQPAFIIPSPLGDQHSLHLPL